MVIYLERGANDLGPADPTATTLSFASLNSEWFNLSDVGLLKSSWKRGR